MNDMVTNMRFELRRLRPLALLLAVICVLVPCLHSTPLYAQEFDTTELVARCRQALGGTEAWGKILTLKISGELSTFSATSQFKIFRARPDLYRFDYEEAGRRVVMSYDGENAWWQTDWTEWSEVDWARRAPLAQQHAISSEALFGAPCFDLPADRVEGGGLVDLDGEELYALQVRQGSGGPGSPQADIWYLDPESFLPVARVARRAVAVLPVTERTFFSDFREVEGVMFPYSWEIELGHFYRTLEVEQVEVNAGLTNEFFKMPIPPAIATLNNLDGHWLVELKARKVEIQPWIKGGGVSRISSDLDGNLLREEAELVILGQPLQVRRLYAYDRLQEVLQMSQIIDKSFSLDNFSGAWDEEGNLTLTSVPGAHQKAMRVRISEIQEDSFKMVWESRRETPEPSSATHTDVDADHDWLSLVEAKYLRKQD